MKTNPHDNAHPLKYLDKDKHGFTKLMLHAGLTKREYFAAMAMQGILSNPHYSQQDMADLDKAEYAVELADRLINALNQEG